MDELLARDATQKKAPITPIGFFSLLYLDERPLQGMAGLVDWHFDQIISKNILASKISGALGEWIYIPTIPRPQQNHAHVFLIGMGTLGKYGKRGKLSANQMAEAGVRINRMGIKKWILSAQEFKEMNQDALLKGLGLDPSLEVKWVP